MEAPMAQVPDLLNLLGDASEGCSDAATVRYQDVKALLAECEADLVEPVEPVAVEESGQDIDLLTRFPRPGRRRVAAAPEPEPAVANPRLLWATAACATAVAAVVVGAIVM
jgi:hypothetical protein